ncbi:Polyketide cyclase / dehydrase and lipid transport [Nocardiopsis flavescens]|uniref:Polyketide cyclase / dehydrase and lipid transport n=1 Tax=Nocardiopsis flavescens TaxID=758803 RepID=A0A1M6T2V4_9ACTN|nr:Polyketide cyclase / dehydrase and lipid transport [Nocardiopsis flavescens]
MDAPASRIFAILASPERHPDIDGSGTVRGSRFGPPELAPDARFGMDMKLFGLPYRMTNRVVEYEKDRLIAWRHFGTHRWRYELEELPGGGTRVTETFDYSRGFSQFYVLAGMPARNARGIEATLVRLKELAERE